MIRRHRRNDRQPAIHHRKSASRKVQKTTKKTAEINDFSGFQMVAEEGFEPSQTESESVVLPLHNSAMSFVVCRFLRTNEYYYTHVGVECQEKIQKNL